MTYRIPENIPHEVFRTYDIRGEASETNISLGLAYAIGLALGSEAVERNIQTFVVGRDARLTGADLKIALMTGLRATGIDVIDIGVVPTPLVYFATHQLPVRSGVMVTASHNPANHNGFKIVLGGETLNREGVQAIYHRILERRLIQDGKGGLSVHDILPDYLRCILQKIHLQSPLTVVVDCGNGVAGHLVPILYRQLGCNVIPLFCEVDGRFPNHHPDPTVPENLQDLIAAVQRQQADVGFAFDGDADRLGVVTNRGEIIWPDRQMMLFSQELLAKHPGATIVFDVKCSSHLPRFIEQAGGRAVMCRTGHSLVKAKMIEEQALLAGEMSGHIFFKENWFGFDDGIYVGARLLEILSQKGRSISEIFKDLPNSINTPELKLPMAEKKKKDFMQRLLDHANFAQGKRITLDGLRVEFPTGWGLVRPSNTSPYLTLRFEADTIEDLVAIKTIFRQQLLAIDDSLQLPF